MFRRSIIVAVLAAGVAAQAIPAPAAPDTTVRTIQDLNGDNLLEFAPGEPYLVIGAPEGFRPPRDGSLLNFLHLSDFQMVDEESPARVEFLDSNQRAAFRPFSAAYRPMESLTTQVTEAMVRAARNARSRMTGEPLDLTIITGDNADSQQYNETRWFIDILDGTTGARPKGLASRINPNSGKPEDGCEATPDSVYDGVRGGGEEDAPDSGYYEPDASGPNTDGDGYSPDREENAAVTGGSDVALRDFPGLLEAANSPFEAVGVDMPWYSAFGNHDAQIQGNSGDAYFGPYGPSGETSNPTFTNIAIGCNKPILPPPGGFEGFIGDRQNAVIVPPDARRCFLAKDEPIDAPAPCDKRGWIGQHFLTTGAPRGHGFAATSGLSKSARAAAYGRPAVADENNDGYYSFSPRPGLRFVVLDTITDECGSPFCSEGSVDDPQFQWLKAQITKAQSMRQYVMVFSHHTLKTTRWPSSDPTEQPIHYGQRIDRDNPFNPQNVTVETLEELYCKHRNVLAHISGHEHQNYTRHYTCEDEEVNPVTGPSNFWFVSSAAHIDWPQQARTIELIDNGKKTMSLVLTVLDHAGRPNPGTPKRSQLGVLTLASIGRELSFNDYQGDRAARGRPTDRNLLIVLDRPWPYPRGAGQP